MARVELVRRAGVVSERAQEHFAVAALLATATRRDEMLMEAGDAMSLDAYAQGLERRLVRAHAALEDARLREREQNELVVRALQSAKQMELLLARQREVARATSERREQRDSDERAQTRASGEPHMLGERQ
jgi:hypothetical protein